jgi:hypothetical protein
MLIDHVGRVFFPDNILFMIIGRLSFPLFCWFIIVGVDYTKNIYKYALRVLYLALFSQIPYYILFHNHNLNVCFTLLFGIIMIIVYRSILNVYLKILLALLIFIIPDLLNFDYGSYGIATIILIYFLKGKWEVLLFSYTLFSIISIQVYKYEVLQLYAIISILMIIFMRSEKIRINRFFNYSFYPIHLFFLYFLTLLF